MVLLVQGVQYHQASACTGLYDGLHLYIQPVDLVCEFSGNRRQLRIHEIGNYVRL